MGPSRGAQLRGEASGPAPEPRGPCLRPSQAGPAAWGPHSLQFAVRGTARWDHVPRSPLPLPLALPPRPLPLVGSARSGLSTHSKCTPTWEGRRKLWGPRGGVSSPVPSPLASLSRPKWPLQGRDCRGSRAGSWEAVSTSKGGEGGRAGPRAGRPTRAISQQSPSPSEVWPSSPRHRRGRACGVVGSPPRCRTAERTESGKPGRAEQGTDPCPHLVLGAASSEPSHPPPGPPRKGDPSSRCL